MMRLERVPFDGIAGEIVLAELTMPEPTVLARDSARLHEAERELAKTFKAAARKDAFLAGRLAAHAALADAGDSRAHRMPILRDARGKPSASWAEAPAFSIAHTRIRAVAAVSRNRDCRALGVDAEEILADRAEALLRMAISPEERGLLAKVDPRLLSAPIALWCAREACVKAHALEVGWFGSALRVTAMTPATDRAPDAEMSFDVEVRLESRPPMAAHAWIANGAAFAIAAR
ncbi:MAG: 4-phosphopantetheinyl transferase N-terminal domain [Planctomycetota bacterium]